MTCVPQLHQQAEFLQHAHQVTNGSKEWGLLRVLPVDRHPPGPRQADRSSRRPLALASAELFPDPMVSLASADWTSTVTGAEHRRCIRDLLGGRAVPHRFVVERL